SQKTPKPNLEFCVAMLSRTLPIVALVVVLTNCATPVLPRSDDVIGEWEKQGNFLPPINLVLSRNDGGGILGRLRLSGVEANGTATAADTKLRLSFRGREDI